MLSVYFLYVVDAFKQVQQRRCQISTFDKMLRISGRCCHIVIANAIVIGNNLLHS